MLAYTITFVSGGGVYTCPAEISVDSDGVFHGVFMGGSNLPTVRGWAVSRHFFHGSLENVMSNMRDYVEEKAMDYRDEVLAASGLEC